MYKIFFNNNRKLPRSNVLNIHSYFSLLNNKIEAQNIWSLDLVHKEPFDCRVARQGYLLTYSQEQNKINCFIKINF